MRNFILLFFISFIIVSYKCNSDDCVGEPIVLLNNEHLNIQFLTQKNESIFESGYHLDSLKIIENDNLVKYEVEQMSFPVQTIISFPISINHFDTLKQNLGNVLKAMILLEFNKIETDTLNIQLFPVQENNCRQEYEKIHIHYNSQKIETFESKSCISCRKPIIITKI